MAKPDLVDDLELEAVGYARAMPRNFSIFSLIGLSFAMTATWLGTGSSVGIAIGYSSTAGAIWTLPIAAFMTAIVSAGMAELASAYPVAGAQYYWSFMVSTRPWAPFAAYVYVGLVTWSFPPACTDLTVLITGMDG